MSADTHRHRCMRCGEEFDCRTPGVCRAGYDVLPTIVLPDGSLVEHCPSSETPEDSHAEH